jgi:hypothetical protein
MLHVGEQGHESGATSRPTSLIVTDWGIPSFHQTTDFYPWRHLAGIHI